MDKMKPKNHKENCQCYICKAIKGETFGKNNSCFRGGNTLQKHFCKLCNKPIGLVSALYKRGLCRKCCFNEETKIKMSQAKIGHIPWNKGLIGIQKGYWMGKSNKDVIVKHHIDGNKKNDIESNFLKLPQGQHRSLHWLGYEYLTKINKINDYIDNFMKEHKDKVLGKAIVHHINCKRNDNVKSNLLYLKNRQIHNKLHQDAYLYLVKQNKVYDYFDWFFLKKKKNYQQSKVIEELK